MLAKLQFTHMNMKFLFLPEIIQGLYYCKDPAQIARTNKNYYCITILLLTDIVLFMPLILNR